jgi:TIR domain/WD domain, G-beta repeat
MSMSALVPIAALAMAPDASWFVGVAEDGTVRTWGADLALRDVRTLAIEALQPVAVARRGSRLRVLWAAGGRIRLYEHFEGARPRDGIFPAPARVRALALSPSGSIAVVACDDGTLRSLNAGTGEFGPVLATGTATASAVAMASDSGPVVAAFPDGSIRRYDLAAGITEIVGIRPGVRRVAVTPDGAAVIAGDSDGVLVRWKPSVSPLPAYWAIGAPLGALATDGPGNKVLAAVAAGGLWLHDLTGGPAVEFGADGPAAPVSVPVPPPALVPPPASVPPPAPAPPVPVPPSATAPWGSPPPGDFRAVVDNDVCFTVYRPQALTPGVWASLLVFAHKTDLVERPGAPPVDPVRQVERMARAHFGDTRVRAASEDARSGVFRGARLRVVADLPDISCNPGDAEFDWREPVHQVEFRLLARPGLIGSVVRGAVRVWCGPLLLGEVYLAISVTVGAPGARSPAVAESAPRYRKIFPSYSHDDRGIVDGFAEAARALGDQYLQDVLALRSGERWRARLPQLIEEADIFQLFWSSNSMRSNYCREEWEHALALRRPLFVRPLYWEDPLPQDPAMGLPPVALRELEFVRVRPYPAASSPQPQGPPELAAPAGAGPPPPYRPAGAGPAAPPRPRESESRTGPGVPSPLRHARDRLGHRRFGRLPAVGVAAAVAACLIAVVTLAGLFGPSRRPPPASPATTRPATATPSSTGPALAPGVAPLPQLLPKDMDDTATQCTTVTPPFQWRMPGLVQALSCADPGLPKGRVYAFQMDSRAHFETAFGNFNAWWGITSAGPTCPPAAGRAGITGFRNDFFPLRRGQVLECKTLGTSPGYAWTYPTQDAFLMAQGAPGSSFTALDTWWVSNSLPPSSPRAGP